MKTVSGKRLAKLAEANGWELRRINGSHHIYGKAAEEEIVTIPIHGNKDLRPGTQRSIMKSAGIQETDL